MREITSRNPGSGRVGGKHEAAVNAGADAVYMAEAGLEPGRMRRTRREISFGGP